jgi:signal peptidase II
MIFLIASLVFVLDRLTKIAVVKAMAYGQSIKILPNIFHLTFIFNNGTAFGLLKGQNTSLAVFSALAAIFIIVYGVTQKGLSLWFSLALGLILGGALGNLFDRIRFGHVIDFLDFRVWPVFNVADSAITIGMAILIIILCTRHSLR